MLKGADYDLYLQICSDCTQSNAHARFIFFQAELKRLCAQFRVVPNFHWIVVEDSAAKTRLVSDLLRSCGVPYTQLNVPTPEDWKIAEVR